MTDVELDARVTALEENSGGSSQNGAADVKFLDTDILHVRMNT